MVDRRSIVTFGAVVLGAIGGVGLVLDSARSEEPAPRPTPPPVIEGTPGEASQPKAAERPAPQADPSLLAQLPPLMRPDPPAATAASGPAPKPAPARDANTTVDANSTTDNNTTVDANATARPAPQAPGQAPTAAALAAKGAGPTGAWEASLAQREQALARTQEAILAQLKRLEELQAAVETRWREADALQKLAASRWTQATLTTPDGVIHLPASGEEREAQLALVATIVKKMKPSEAARLMAQWDDPLTVDVLARLSPRSSSPVLAKMPPELAARLTRILARTGPPTPLRGDKK